MTALTGAPDTQDRLDAVIDLIAQLASGDLCARAVPSEHEDDLDAVLVGINMLAEDLEASQEQLEARVSERTAELAAVNRDITRLVDLGHRLQTSVSRADVLLVLECSLSSIFLPLSGALHLFGDTDVPTTVSWGLTTPPGSPPNAGQDPARIPISVGDRVLGLLVLSGGPADAPHVLHKRRLGTATADQVAMTLTSLDLRDTLREQALRDPLTGLYNRRFVEEWLGREVSRADRNHSALGVVMMDIDHFKPVNDTYGHEAGDAVLVSVATVISGTTRTGDVACRYGGEEFLVLMPGITRAALAERAEELCSRIARTRTEHGGRVLPPVTVSVGVALSPEHGRTPAELLRAADDALYAAKDRGRDQVRLPD